MSRFVPPSLDDADAKIPTEVRFERRSEPMSKDVVEVMARARLARLRGTDDFRSYDKASERDRAAYHEHQGWPTMDQLREDARDALDALTEGGWAVVRAENLKEQVIDAYRAVATLPNTIREGE